MLDTIIILEERIELLKTNVNASNIAAQGPNSGSAVTANRTKLKLPPLGLPEFHGDSTKDKHTCLSFFCLFEAMLVDYNLKREEKFGMLEGQTKGRPCPYRS